MTNEAIPTVDTKTQTELADRSDTDLLRTCAAEQAAAAPPVSSENDVMIAHILQLEHAEVRVEVTSRTADDRRTATTWHRLDHTLEVNNPTGEIGVVSRYIDGLAL